MSGPGGVEGGGSTRKGFGGTPPRAPRRNGEPRSKSNSEPPPPFLPWSPTNLSGGVLTAEDRGLEHTCTLRTRRPYQSSD